MAQIYEIIDGCNRGGDVASVGLTFLSNGKVFLDTSVDQQYSKMFMGLLNKDEYVQVSEAVFNKYLNEAEWAYGYHEKEQLHSRNVSLRDDGSGRV